MALVIRLRQQGRTNRQSYRFVVTDKRSPRDGKYIEKIGWYNPFAKEEKNLFIEENKLFYWLEKGAILSEKARSLIKRVLPEQLKKFEERKQVKKIKKKAEKKKIEKPKMEVKTEKKKEEKPKMEVKTEKKIKETKKAIEKKIKKTKKTEVENKK